MEAKCLDVTLWDRAFMFAETTGVVPQNATDAEISALLSVMNDGGAVSRFIQQCKETLCPPFFGYKILNNNEDLYLCELLLPEDSKYTYDEYYPKCGRCDKALVTRILPCFGVERKSEVLSVFMGSPTLYKEGEFVVADKFDVNELKCGIHFFPAEYRASRYANEYKKHIQYLSVPKQIDDSPLDLSTVPWIVKEVRNYSNSMWTLGKLHGVNHWDRVYKNGLELVTPDVDSLVVSLFAYLHDSRRETDGEDIDHGERASVFIDVLRDNLLKDVSDEQICLLKQACSLHTTTHKTGNPTVDASFDADRLDLWRVGIIPDPDRLATKKGKEIAVRKFSGYVEDRFGSLTGFQLRM